MLVCVVMLIAILVMVIVWPGGETDAQTYSPVTAADDARADRVPGGAGL